jgi:hypothetical protein
MPALVSIQGDKMNMLKIAYNVAKTLFCQNYTCNANPHDGKKQPNNAQDYHKSE